MIFEPVRAHWKKTQHEYHSNRKRRAATLAEFKLVFEAANLFVDEINFDDACKLFKPLRVVASVRNEMYTLQDRALDGHTSDYAGNDGVLPIFWDDLLSLENAINATAAQEIVTGEWLRLVPFTDGHTARNPLPIPYCFHLYVLYYGMTTEVAEDTLLSCQRGEFKLPLLVLMSYLFMYMTAHSIEY